MIDHNQRIHDKVSLQIKVDFIIGIIAVILFCMFVYFATESMQ